VLRDHVGAKRGKPPQTQGRLILWWFGEEAIAESHKRRVYLSKARNKWQL
jgi:hypothetical protein